MSARSGEVEPFVCFDKIAGHPIAAGLIGNAKVEQRRDIAARRIGKISCNRKVYRAAVEQAGFPGIECFELHVVSPYFPDPNVFCGPCIPRPPLSWSTIG